ncbi:hypothetical protein SGLAD_v1c07790 [Spiroplasma gladiatoris]|uniref:Lipoprotein n=1 Tax=Spiroplasma gladiatoris TaxID=2143 RepID=A0A4P7AJJ5_9MOLU|nr:lipoprotein [Spiroplasma gladiatoris]QBQ07978.1 hypothetical protein SGLAD_v1c07790 [Spiroplasma gladiatoris]
MKKIISLLSVLSIITTSSSSLVACEGFEEFYNSKKYYVNFEYGQTKSEESQKITNYIQTDSKFFLDKGSIFNIQSSEEKVASFKGSKIITIDDIDQSVAPNWENISNKNISALKELIETIFKLTDEEGSEKPSKLFENILKKVSSSELIYGYERSYPVASQEQVNKIKFDDLTYDLVSLDNEYIINYYIKYQSVEKAEDGTYFWKQNTFGKSQEEKFSIKSLGGEKHFYQFNTSVSGESIITITSPTYNVAKYRLRYIKDDKDEEIIFKPVLNNI